MRINQPTIVLTGNIASGKSTLAKGLLAKLPGWQYACVDRLRVEMAKEGNTGLQAEHRAATVMQDLITANAPVLYESSGATQLYRRLNAMVRGYRKGPVVRIRTTCDHATAMQRFHARKTAGHRQMAPAFPGALPIAECWYRFEDLLREPADLVLDTNRLSAEETLAKAWELVQERIPQGNATPTAP